MADNTWDKITNRQTAMSELNKRMDNTEKLLMWDDNPYQLVKPDGKTKLRDAISVTPNLPKVFAHGVISDLLGGKWQTVVEGNISDKQSHLVEEFVEDNLAQTDEVLLTEHGIPSLFGWLCNHVCTRYAIGARWRSQVVAGEYKITCVPVDMRWTPYVLGKWVAPITFRSKADLEEELEEYEKIAKDGRLEYTKPSLLEQDNEVRDYWEDKRNELWVGGKQVIAQKNTLGYPPFVIAIPASGFMFRGKGYMKHEGEDVLFLNAGLYTELARSISLEQTSGYAGLYPGYQRQRKNFDGKPAEPAPELDETVDVQEGEKFEPVPRGDINRAGQTARADLQDMISNGAPLSPKQYNTPPSAILLAGETEMIARLQNARKDALGIFRSQLARMMIDQFIKLGKPELLIGKQGKGTKYSASKLGNPKDYAISYHLSVKSKRQELANLAEFTAVYGRLPLKWNLINILMADDPAGIIKDMELEKAKEADPAIGLGEMGIRYAEEAEEMEDSTEKDLKNFQSMLLIERAVSIIKQRMQPVPLPQSARVPEVEKAKGNGQLLNAMGGAEGALRGEETRQPEEVTNAKQAA